jgi:hypothetical protein
VCRAGEHRVSASGFEPSIFASITESISSLLDNRALVAIACEHQGHLFEVGCRAAASTMRGVLKRTDIPHE